ncbi:hypothetical protein [Blastococcus litoris]|uniref:hypothetical protein n=1 Tax=Blastococcus litoris TaxID=2171622 RepID=UPI000E300739|nr:hypothetical protein [Blastococcus litoris]
MPLRSVEAASRDDAIAAAREQFGPQARVVGVRRVRSGGVLGFFATERYVAEVAELAPETAIRPAVPSRSDRDDELPADFSSPLASAAPARARSTAPARNGAAAWAAEAAARPVDDDIPEEVRAAAAAARAARSGGASRPATAPRPSTPDRAADRATPAPARSADEEKVSELVGLLAAQQSEPPAPAYSRTSLPRAAFPRAGTISRGDDAEELPTSSRSAGPRASAPSAPSPFTAALARMVAGDQDVRQAVQEALVQKPETTPAQERDPEPWPVRSEPTRTADTSVPSSTARQEEDTVGNQVMARPAPTEHPVDVPTWAAAPEVTTPSASQREEAIADLLRGALAQGHSDEALAGILRKVLAGASPQTALAEPVAAPEPVFAVPTVPVPSMDLSPVAEPVLDLPVPAPAVVAAPVAEVPVPDVPVAEAPAEVAPVEVPVEVATVVEPVAEPVAIEPVAIEPAAPAPVVPPTVEVAPAPVAFSTSSGSMWGETSSASLWGEPAAVARRDDTPIWAEVGQQPDEALLFDEPAAEPQAEAADEVADEVEAEAEAEEVADEVEAVAVVEAEIAGEAAEAPAVEEAGEEAGAAELAPVLARTASDPAPMMSLDATTVMPPLSLLPPLPSSRGRGRPPVPPTAPRSASRTSVPAAAAPAPEAPAEELPEPVATDVAADETPIATASLATVTRLPVAPLMAGPDVSELPEDFDQLCAQELLDAPEPAATPVEPTPVSVVAGDVAGRLVQLGLPAELLGSTFRADAVQLGTYAALTRSLALQLPKAPELPRGAGQVVFVVGPGADALRAARSLAASQHLDPDCVQWATRGDLAGLAPRSSRITSVESAIDRRNESIATGTVTIVAVDAPLRTDAYWMAQMVSVWAPVAVWAVVEATRKPEDLEPWLDGLPRVDALIVQDADLSADPAAVLRRVDAPVAVIDGVRATPHRWASLLCERLESTSA